MNGSAEVGLEERALVKSSSAHTSSVRDNFLAISPTRLISGARKAGAVN